MTNDFTFISADSKTVIYTTEWIPDTYPRAVLQICHGMVEHIKRYDRFARFMNENGIYVVGNDLLGHGRSVTHDDDHDMHGYFRQPNGIDCVIDDLHTVRTITEKKYPGVPYFVLGFSMGSFIIREYTMLYGEGLSGAIVMGTGSQPQALVAAGQKICTAIAASKGWHHRSKFVDGMAFGSYNKKFEPARTYVDWLTRDESIVDAYVADPFCGYTFTLNGYREMFRCIEYIQRRSNVRKTPKSLPIIFMAGEDDPVGDFGKGVRTAYERYISCGYKNISIKLYPECRHEILSELNYTEVFNDVLSWISDRI